MSLVKLLNVIMQAHVEYETGKRHYAHVDCPGHADYVKVSFFKFDFHCYLIYIVLRFWPCVLGTRFQLRILEFRTSKTDSCHYIS